MTTYIAKLLASYFPWKSSTYVDKTTLHQAIRKSSSQDVHELIKNGVDINFKGEMSSSPICDAIYYRQNETICLLLYYGAELEFIELFWHGKYLDRNLLSSTDEFRNITKILLNYCTVGDDMRIEGYCQQLINRYSIIGTFLVESRHSESVLAELFLTIVSQMDPIILLNFQTPFLLIYLQSCEFCTSTWLKCLYSMLELPHAADLVRHVVYSNNCGSCFIDLVLAFEYKNVKRRDRTAIIWIWLSLGAVVTIGDIDMALLHFGYCEEVEALIYGFNNYGARGSSAIRSTIDILPLEDNHKFIYSILSKTYLYSHCDAPKTILKILNYFTLSKHTKQKVILKCQNTPGLDWSIVFEKLERIDSCPSLAELSRDQVRRTIKQTYVIAQPYHYFEIIKSLNIPNKIKDVILFKHPLYNF